MGDFGRVMIVLAGFVAAVGSATSNDPPKPQQPQQPQQPQPYQPGDPGPPQQGYGAPTGQQQPAADQSYGQPYGQQDPQQRPLQPYEPQPSYGQQPYGQQPYGPPPQQRAQYTPCEYACGQMARCNLAPYQACRDQCRANGAEQQPGGPAYLNSLATAPCDRLASMMAAQRQRQH